jgi:hypothetical protein
MTTPKEPRGYPYGNWYLYIMDEDGTWNHHLVQFKLDKTMTQGKTVKVRLEQLLPVNMKAITISPVEDGMDFTLWRFIDFYTDPSYLPADKRDAAPESIEDQIAAYAGREYPLTAQYFQYQAYSGGDSSGGSSGGRQGGYGYYDPPNGTNNYPSATTR